jgi:hypothetical protein
MLEDLQVDGEILHAVGVESVEELKSDDAASGLGMRRSDVTSTSIASAIVPL